ncbi:hypothetical protein [Synechococcus sp. PCC 7336]|uniref:hypothetical protein n=1 Tax=Synechococcus sp. PCC 7336 TaxID=195250 RepID=UPI00034D92D7|nr:hypothetical protein [Synechococcus sp. PCC 7336]
MQRLLPLGFAVGILTLATVAPALAYPSPDDDIDPRSPIAPLVLPTRVQLQRRQVRRIEQIQIQPQNSSTAAIPQVVPCAEDLPPGIWGAGCIANPFPHPQVD